MELRSTRPWLGGACSLFVACVALSRAVAQSPEPPPPNQAPPEGPVAAPAPPSPGELQPTEDEPPEEPVRIITTTLVGRVEVDAPDEREGSASRRPLLPEVEEPRAEWLLPELEWEPHWGRSGIPNYLMIGISAVVALVDIGVGPRTDNPSRGGWLFDEDVRGAVRLSTETQRRFARDASDVLLTVMTSYPMLIDAITVAAWLHDSPDVAAEMALMNAEVVAVTFAIQSTINVAVSRERPYGRTCGGGGPDDLPETVGYCETSNRFFSFFSGHTSQSFASAALTCMHHLNMNLYGGGGVEMVPCVAGFALAAVTSGLRILGDMHYATDVLTGAIVGTATGFLVPYLFHYHDGPPRHRHDRDGERSLQVTVVPTPMGVQVLGVF